MKIQTLPMKYLLIAVLALLSTAIIVGAAARRRIERAQESLPIAIQSTPSVTNKTKAIKVTNLNVTNGIVEVTLLNQSSKFIDFYTFSIGDERITPLAGIEPGGTTVQKFSLSHFAEAAKNGSVSGQLVILALNFGGGGGEGDAEEVSHLEDTALGMKEQIKLLLPTLFNAVNSSAIESEDSLRSLEDEVVRSSVNQEKIPFSSGRKRGQTLVKQQIVMDLKTLREMKRLDQSKNYRNGLVERTSYYQRRYSQL